MAFVLARKAPDPEFRRTANGGAKRRWCTKGGKLKHGRRKEQHGIGRGFMALRPKEFFAFLGNSAQPPKKFIGSKGIGKGLANPTQGWEKSGCENRFVFPFSNSGCFCRDFSQRWCDKSFVKKSTQTNEVSQSSLNLAAAFIGKMISSKSCSNAANV